MIPNRLPIVCGDCGRGPTPEEHTDDWEMRTFVPTYGSRYRLIDSRPVCPHCLARRESEAILRQP